MGADDAQVRLYLPLRVVGVVASLRPLLGAFVRLLDPAHSERGPWKRFPCRDDPAGTKETTMSTDTMRTITLSDRPPVRIMEDEWPEIAVASYHDFDGQYDFQSFRHWRGRLTVRQHADGRALVYGRCWYEETKQGASTDYDQRAGELLDSSSSSSLIEAIRRVHARITVVDDAHADQWHLLADECIADLPAERI